MSRVDEICHDNLKRTDIHKDFRLILTTDPSEGIPVSVVQNGVKVATYSTSGFKNTLLESLSS